MGTTYKTDIKLGERYRDNITGLEGVAIGVHFYQHACERVTLRYSNGLNEVTEASFDAPELTNVKTEKVPHVDRPGGPARHGELTQQVVRR